MLMVLTYLVIGAAASFVVGLLGLGAGLVILPALSMAFSGIFPHALALKVTVGTCLFTFIPIASSTAWHYYKKQKPSLGILYAVLPGYAVGGVLAPWVTHRIPAHFFHLLVGSILVLMAFFIFIRTWKAPTTQLVAARPYKRITVFLVSVGVALLCGTAGLGSGLLMIPFLARAMPQMKAVAISITAAVFYAFITSVSYIVVGWHAVPGSPSWVQWGYVYMPAALLIALPAFFFASLGVRLAHALPVARLKMLFSLLVLAAGVDLMH
jgi:uncharacterized protein